MDSAVSRASPAQGPSCFLSGLVYCLLGEGSVGSRLTVCLQVLTLDPPTVRELRHSGKPVTVPQRAYSHTPLSRGLL